MKNDINRHSRHIPRHFFGRNINGLYNSQPLRKAKSIGSMTLAIIPLTGVNHLETSTATDKNIMGSTDKGILKFNRLPLFPSDNLDPFSMLLKMGLMRHQDLGANAPIIEQTATPKSDFVLDPSKNYTEVNLEIKCLDDLINLGKTFREGHTYPFDLGKLHKLLPTLDKLKNMIGMEKVKKSIVNQIVYFLASIEENDNMLHTAIAGPPGVGKTVLGKIIGEVYYNMGIIKGNGKKYIDPQTGGTLDFIFKIAKRSDLIGEYLGHTAVKTQRVIDECLGGVLFIDEAYSLGSGNTDRKDSYAKECIDTLNQNLTEKKKNFICIIAGYPEELEKCFFSQNEGLRRRFPFRYDIDKYNSRELGDILMTMINGSSWEVDSDTDMDTIYSFMKDNYEKFPYFGGDIENLIFHVKISHAHRVIGLHPKHRKKISLADITKGFDAFCASKETKPDEGFYQHLYT